jgi:hypothetical protein
MPQLAALLTVINYAPRAINYALGEHLCIFSCVQPFYEQAVSDLGP